MTDLTDRMRTCAAHMLASDPHETLLPVYRDAVDLLIEAATLLECVADRGEIIPIVNIPPPIKQDDPPLTAHPEQALPAILNDRLAGVWIGDDLKPLPSATRNRNACPQCDSRSQKRVWRENRMLVLECPVCGLKWRR